MSLETGYHRTVTPWIAQPLSCEPGRRLLSGVGRP
jgi:hypothetical protein